MRQYITGDIMPSRQVFSRKNPFTPRLPLPHPETWGEEVPSKRRRRSCVCRRCHGGEPVEPIVSSPSTVESARVIRGFYERRLEMSLWGNPGACKRAGCSPLERMAAMAGVPLDFAIKFASVVQLAIFPEEFDPDEDPDVKAELESIYLATEAAPVTVGTRSPGFHEVARKPNGEKVERGDDGSTRCRVLPDALNLKGHYYGATAGLVPDGRPTVTEPDFLAFAKAIQDAAVKDED